MFIYRDFFYITVSIAVFYLQRYLLRWKTVALLLRRMCIHLGIFTGNVVCYTFLDVFNNLNPG
jgi:hypothetical protein